MGRVDIDDRIFAYLDEKALHATIPHDDHVYLIRPGELERTQPGTGELVARIEHQLEGAVLSGLGREGT